MGQKQHNNDGPRTKEHGRFPKTRRHYCCYLFTLFCIEWILVRNLHVIISLHSESDVTGYVIWETFLCAYSSENILELGEIKRPNNICKFSLLNRNIYIYIHEKVIDIVIVHIHWYVWVTLFFSLNYSLTGFDSKFISYMFTCKLCWLIFNDKKF